MEQIPEIKPAERSLPQSEVERLQLARQYLGLLDKIKQECDRNKDKFIKDLNLQYASIFCLKVLGDVLDIRQLPKTCSYCNSERLCPGFAGCLTIIYEVRDALIHILIKAPEIAMPKFLEALWEVLNSKDLITLSQHIEGLLENNRAKASKIYESHKLKQLKNITNSLPSVLSAEILKNDIFYLNVLKRETTYIRSIYKEGCHDFIQCAAFNAFEVIGTVISKLSEDVYNKFIELVGKGNGAELKGNFLVKVHITLLRTKRNALIHQIETKKTLGSFCLYAASIEQYLIAYINMLTNPKPQEQGAIAPAFSRSMKK